MAEINASYIKRQIAKLAYQDPRGDGFERVFPDIPVDPGVNQDCCATDGGTNPMDMPCAGMFVYIWTTLVPACLREQTWRPEDLSLSPEDFDRYNDANDDFPVTIPPHLYLGDWDCEIDIWKIIPYSDTNFDWPRDETGEPIGPNLPGDRANRKIKLQEILQCFRRFYASVLAQQGEHTLNWDLNNPCCSIANLNKMMTIMRLFACLSTITEGNIPHADGGTRIISDKLRQKMIKCINCIDKKCQLA